MEKSLPDILEEVRQVQRIREDILKSRNAMTMQINAIKKRFKTSDVDPTEFMDEAEGLEIFKESEKIYVKQMEALAKLLPCYDWYCSMRGCSALGYASLIGETGDLRNYANPAKVWKRMGLSVNNGQADKNRTKGVNTGYSKRRRMVAYRMSSAIVKARGEYRPVYDERKQYETNRNEAGGNADYVKTNYAHMSKTYTSTENKKRIQNGQLPQCVIDLRAHRYMVKRLIKDVWAEWQKLN